MSLSHRRLRMKADDSSNIGSQIRNSQLVEPSYKTAKNLLGCFLSQKSPTLCPSRWSLPVAAWKKVERIGRKRIEAPIHVLTVIGALGKKSAGSDQQEAKSLTPSQWIFEVHNREDRETNSVMTS